MKNVYCSIIFVLILKVSFAQSSNEQIPDSVQIFTSLQVMPTYMDGEKALNALFNKNVDFNICNTISSSFQFIVTPEGRLAQIRKYGAANNCDEKFEQVLRNTSGLWIPGTMNGIKKYTQIGVLLEVSKKDVKVKILN